MQIKKITTDILIIGAGGSGLRAAIEATNHGANVLLLSKESMGHAHTSQAMGGLNVAVKAPATPEQHYTDTIEGGWKINNYKLAKIFSEEMPERIYDLENYGVKFDKLPDGTFYTWAGGKQTAPLNLCAGDYTGREMINGLVAEIKRLQIPYLDNHFVTKLFVKDGLVLGTLVMDKKDGALTLVEAKAIINATGGAGMMYLITTNEPTNTGEGYAWALDAGCELVDMEMVQIHPTGIAYPEKRKGRLITEKVRGHFGTLKNKHGERFMSRYYPEKMELAGRDEVARSIYQEVKEGRGTKHGGVYLDVTHWEEGKAEKTIPEVFEGFMRDGIDIRKEMMEISPSMHHMMGGININEWGETCVKNMYAVGEVTRNIHGANRLGGNSLAEGQVFGRRAGIRAAEKVKHEKLHEIPLEMIKDEMKRLKSFERDEGLSAQDLALQLKTVMWEKVGLIRDEEGLQEALTVVKNLQGNTVDIAVHDHVELQEALELEEMLKVAETVIVAALLRKESRGAHYRTDYPEMEKEWEKNILVYKDKNGNLQTKIIPVEK